MRDDVSGGGEGVSVGEEGGGAALNYEGSWRTGGLKQQIDEFHVRPSLTSPNNLML
jgi:hypothetical protein